MADLYDELGVGPDATPEEIKAAHRRGVRQHHPDAGGERARFDRIQTAYRILSDQRLKDRYDRTGAEVDTDPEMALRAQALTIVAAKMNEILTDPRVHPEQFDLVLGIKERLDQDGGAMHQQIRDSKNMQARLRKFEKRLKRRADVAGPDRIRPTITAQIEAHEARIVQMEDGLKVIAYAKELVEEYVYEIDQPQHVQLGAWSTRPGWP